MNKIRDINNHLNMLLNIFEARSEHKDKGAKNLLIELNTIKKDFLGTIKEYNLSYDFIVPLELDPNTKTQGINFLVPIANRIREVQVYSFGRE